MSGDKSTTFLEIITNVSAVTMTAAVIFVLADFYRRSLRDIPVSYRISVLGLPRSGKTALVSAMFGELFATRIGGHFKPAGAETINRVNRYIALLDTGRPIPPTTEKDVFLFRFLYHVRRLLPLGRVRYEGEVVDFPGELSEKLLESASDGSLADDLGIFHREFYSWIVSSRVIVFVIDLGAYLSSEDRPSYVASLSSEIRAAWQLLQEEMSQSIRLERRRVAIVFTKLDVVRVYAAGIHNSEHFVEAVRKTAYHRPFGPDDHLPEDLGPAVAEVKQNAIADFQTLISYFEAQGSTFGHFFVSAYARVGGHRVGIPELLRFILPNRTM